MRERCETGIDALGYAGKGRKERIKIDETLTDGSHILEEEMLLLCSVQKCLHSRLNAAVRSHHNAGATVMHLSLTI